VCVCVHLKCALNLWNLNTSHSGLSLEVFFYLEVKFHSKHSHHSFEIPERRDFIRLTYLNLSMEFLQQSIPGNIGVLRHNEKCRPIVFVSEHNLRYEI